MNYSFRNKYFLLFLSSLLFWFIFSDKTYACLLYTSDAADERSSVDLGGRRIIKKKKKYDSGDDRTLIY